MKVTTFMEFMYCGDLQYKHIALVALNEKTPQAYRYWGNERGDDSQPAGVVFMSGDKELVVPYAAKVTFDKWFDDVAVLELDDKSYLICAAVKNSKKFKNLKNLLKG